MSSQFNIPRKPRKNADEPVVTVGLAPAYEEYKPDLATRLSQERARRDQPPLTTLSSSVPAYTTEKL